MGTMFFDKYYVVLDQTPKHEMNQDYIQIGLGPTSGGV
jgi:hypothetical protein